MLAKKHTVAMPVEYGRYLFGKGDLSFEDIDHLNFLQDDLAHEYGKSAHITKQTQGKAYETLFMGEIRLCRDYVVSVG